MNFAAGNYQLSFFALQSSSNTADQSLDVLIDGKMVGTVAITPTGKSYAQYTTAVFTVTSGLHTITFQGTDKDRNTVLIDAVALNPASALKAAAPHRLPVSIELLSQPGTNVATGIQEPVRIAVLDRSGQLWSGLTVRVTLIRIDNRSRKHIVRGTLLQAKTVNGVATFNDLVIKKPGRYELHVEVGQRHINSKIFDVGT